MTGVTTTRGDRDSNCDRGDRFRHPSHSHCHLVTVSIILSQFAAWPQPLSFQLQLLSLGHSYRPQLQASQPFVSAYSIYSAPYSIPSPRVDHNPRFEWIIATQSLYGKIHDHAPAHQATSTPSPPSAPMLHTSLKYRTRHRTPNGRELRTCYPSPRHVCGTRILEHAQPHQQSATHR